MICSQCGINNATINYKHINNGIIENIHVCRSCYDKQNLSIKYNNAKISTKINIDNSDKVLNKVCDFCGRSLEEIKRTAYVGCEYCYKAFKKELYKILENYHNTQIGDINE